MTRYLSIRGPSVVEVKCSETRLFGAPVETGERIVVPVGRTYLFKTEKEDCVETFTGRIEEDPLTQKLYLVAEDIATQVIEERFERVYLIGYSDTGKSTLAAMIYNMLTSKRENTAFLTIDVGQNEVYMPTFTSLVHGAPVYPGARSLGSQNCFVGSITPVDAVDRYIGCTWNLIDRAKNQMVIIDTDGWVTGTHSHIVKRWIIGSPHKALIVMTRAPKPLRDYFSRLGYTIVELPAIDVSSKTREERSANRIRLVANVFQEAKNVTIYLDDTVVVEPRTRQKREGSRYWESHIAALYSKGELAGVMLVGRLDYEKKRIHGFMVGSVAEPDLVEIGVARFPSVVKSLRSR